VDDYSQLKGSLPVAAGTERVWGVQKKTKVTDRRPENGKKNGKKPIWDRAGKEKQDGQAHNLHADEEVVEGKSDTEEGIGYGSHRMKKKSNRQIDMIV